MELLIKMYMVEVKRRKDIGEEIVEEMKGKLNVLSLPRDMSIRTALVYDGNLSPTVEAAGYFNALVNVRELLF